jgi:hypothetical protein
MSDNTFLQQIGAMIVANNKTLLIAVDEKIQSSEKRTATAIIASKEETFEKIKASQEDTVDVLSEVINTGYSIHEERIQRLEDKVGLPPLGQKH